MMDRLNAVQKTVFAIILAGMVMLVAIPLLFFITVSFSNSTEMTQFPKNIFPSGEVTVYVEPKDDGKYELFYDYQDGSGYTSIITTNNASKLEKHFARQYAVVMDGEEILEEFSRTRTEGAREFTFRKDMFYNFKQFFKIVPNAGVALKNSIIVSLYTILISLSLGSLAGYAIARYQFKGREQINVGLLIVRMFPTVGISIPMAVMLIKMGLYDKIGRAHV